MRLKEQIIARIAAEGPISLSDYMAEALLHPEHGYYATRDPFGTEGDFITAPETSQMFGELLGLCLAQAWLDQGAPSPVSLVELGPGRGTLMRDMLRATRAVPGFTPDVLLVEASARLREIQAKTLDGETPQWVPDLNALPSGPVLFVANEFFDALPIKQFVRAESGWQEVRVGAQGPDLVAGLGAVRPVPELADRLEDTKPGDLVELSPAGTKIAEQIARHIAKHGGAALFVDYGDWRSLGDTFQALKNHKATDPFGDPGSADLTAHVDFEQLAAAIDTGGAAYTRLTPQGVFLERLGITQRAQKLAQGLTGSALDAHIAAHRRLTHPAEMGNLFKVIGAYPRNVAPPPGLDP